MRLLGGVDYPVRIVNTIYGSVHAIIIIDIYIKNMLQ